MKRQPLTVEARYTLIVRFWAERIGLPFGNLWEPALLRYMLREYARLGSDASACAFVSALTCRQLGFSVEDLP